MEMKENEYNVLFNEGGLSPFHGLKNERCDTLHEFVKTHRTWSACKKPTY
jgi:hypothetical protein